MSDRTSLPYLGTLDVPKFFSSLFHRFLYTHSFFFIEDVNLFMNQIKKLLTSLTIVISMTFSVFAFSSHIHVEENNDAAMRAMILHYVNVYRAKHHLTALKLNDTATKVAATHSQAMAHKTIPFGHAHFNDRIQRLYQQLEQCRGGAENVAYYKLNAKRLVDAWIASPGHRRNIEGHYNVTGIGIAHGKTGWAYYTQIFVLTDNRAYV